MNYKLIGRIQSFILLAEGVFLLPAMLISWVDHDTPGLIGLTAGMVTAFVLAGILWLVTRNARRDFHAREGLFCVGLSWIVLSLVGCIPFIVSGAIPSFIDALFEVVSGFTTTGASILANVEELSRGILYWRSFTHWLGGMGVLVFILAIVPVAGKSNGFTMHLMRAESPGPEVSKLTSRMRSSAMILYEIYFGLTAVTFIALWACGMDWFEALCTAYGCAGTGGFGVKADSIAGYSPILQTICTISMSMFGVNFTLYYLLLLKRVKDVFRDEELRAYLLILFGGAFVIALNIRGFYGNFAEAFHHAIFQISSLTTTTGFATADFDTWPMLSKGILVFCMICGAMAGSTGGGFKISRILLLFKMGRRNLHQAMRPDEVETIRINDRIVSEKVVSNTAAYLAIYCIIIIVSCFIVSFDNCTFETLLTSVFATFNNIGPGLGGVGPTCNFGGFSVLSKAVFIFDMLAGRLEIYPIMVLFMRSGWKSF